MSPVLEKAKKQTVRELSHGRHLTAWEQSSLSLLLHCVARGLVRLLRILLVKILRNREAEKRISLGTQTEKDNVRARCRIGQRAWRTKNQCFVSALSLMKKATLGKRR